MNARNVRSKEMLNTKDKPRLGSTDMLMMNLEKATCENITVKTKKSLRYTGLNSNQSFLSITKIIIEERKRNKKGSESSSLNLEPKHLQ